MNTHSQPAADASLAQAIDVLWARFLPEITERVAVLEAAAEAVTAEALGRKDRESAHDAAHKLAGVLGTFGLTHGTVLARELEITFARESSPVPDQGQKLRSIVAELRAMIESRATKNEASAP